MLSQQKIKLMSNALKKIPDLACAYLHGSALTNHFRPTSDIDIALLFLPDTNIVSFVENIFEYSTNIESITGHAVHLSWLSSHNIVFAKEVISKGWLIVCKNAYFCKTFSMHTLSMYANLSQERSKILEQYLA